MTHRAECRGAHRDPHPPGVPETPAWDRDPPLALGGVDRARVAAVRRDERASVLPAVHAVEQRVLDEYEAILRPGVACPPVDKDIYPVRVGRSGDVVHLHPDLDPVATA